MPQDLGPFGYSAPTLAHFGRSAALEHDSLKSSSTAVRSLPLQGVLSVLLLCVNPDPYNNTKKSQYKGGKKNQGKGREEPWVIEPLMPLRQQGNKGSGPDTPYLYPHTMSILISINDTTSDVITSWMQEKLAAPRPHLLEWTDISGQLGLPPVLPCLTGYLSVPGRRSVLRGPLAWDGGGLPPQSSPRAVSSARGACSG